MITKTSMPCIRKWLAALLAVLLVCGTALAAVAEDVTTPTDMTAPEATQVPEPEPTEEPAPVVYTVSVFLQTGAQAASNTWVGQLPLSLSNGVPTMNLEQLSALLSEKGYSVNLADVTFEYGTGSEMQLANWLGSERKGDYAAVALHRAPADADLFVLIAPIVPADEEEEIIIEEDIIDLVGVPSTGEKPTEVRDNRAVAVTVTLPYTVSIQVVDPQEVYYYGDCFTLQAVITGTIVEPIYQWEVMPYGETEWQLVEGATEATYSFILDETNSLYDIRVTVYDAAAEERE